MRGIPKVRGSRRSSVLIVATAALVTTCLAPPTTGSDDDATVGLSISIVPDRVAVQPGDTLVFVARASDENGELAEVQLAWSASGGTISPSGVFVAGDDLGDFLVSAAAGTTQGVARVSVSGGEPTAPSPPSGDPQPNGPSGSWDLSLAEEFDGSSLNTAVWTRHYAWHPTTINNELQYFDPTPGRYVQVSDGTLKLIADRTAGGGKSYSSGAVSSHGKFSFTFGVAEMRAKLPAGTGLWPAFWTMPEGGGWPPEIDVMENIGDPNRVHFNLHHSGGNMGAPSFSGLDTRQWHTYTVHWRSDRIDWYVDGTLRASYTNAGNIPQQSMYLLANLAVGGSWPGSPDGSTPFPATYEIDYIRVWQ